MLTATVYSEAGGVGKTSLTANLGRALSDAGHEVLLIDLDPQDASLSYLLDVDDERDHPEADNLVRYLVGRSEGSLDPIIREAEGMDIIPSHNMLEQISKHLQRRANEAADFGESFNVNKQLLRVLREAGVQDKYDVILIDPAATADTKVYNAIHATRSLIIPFEPTGKGSQSVHGLEDLVHGLEEQLSIDVGVMGIVPNKYKDTRDQQEIITEVQDGPYAVPVVFRERSSLIEGCWNKQCTAFKYIPEHRKRERDYERETLEKFETLAEWCASEVGLEVMEA